MMSFLETPEVDLLITAFCLLLLAFFSWVAIRRWQSKPMRKDKVFQTAPPMMEE